MSPFEAFANQLKNQNKANKDQSEKNDLLLKSLSFARPELANSTIPPFKTQVNSQEQIGPWKTTTTPGDPGAFSRELLNRPQANWFSPDREQNLQKVLSEIDKLRTYTPGSRESTHIEDRRFIDPTMGRGVQSRLMPTTTGWGIPELLKSLFGRNNGPNN